PRTSALPAHVCQRLLWGSPTGVANGESCKDTVKAGHSSSTRWLTRPLLSLDIRADPARRRTFTTQAATPSCIHGLGQIGAPPEPPARTTAATPPGPDSPQAFAGMAEKERTARL